jgi:zinc/manganese transport system permease protein
VRIGIGALLVLSGVWLAVAPRADQPLLDSVELAAPGVRSLYMNERELEVYLDADRYAMRYQHEAEQLNDKEARSRWQGETVSDTDVRRMSSFLQSYHEMRKGEEFVKREVRGRARDRARWTAGALLVLLGLLAVPWRALRRPHGGGAGRAGNP